MSPLIPCRVFSGAPFFRTQAPASARIAAIRFSMIIAFSRHFRRFFMPPLTIVDAAFRLRRFAGASAAIRFFDAADAARFEILR